MTANVTLIKGHEVAAEHPLPLGAKVPTFKLLEPATGKTRTSEELLTKDVFAVYFICNHCPHSMAWEGRLLDLAREFGDRVSTVFISSSAPELYPEDGPDEIKAHATAMSFPAPYLIDLEQTAADAFAAVRTPHAFVFHRTRGLVYNGTVDDDQEDPAAVTKRYLRDAIEAAVAGRDVATPITPLQGCGIKRRADADVIAKKRAQASV
jgi:hypothetical protein